MHPSGRNLLCIACCSLVLSVPLTVVGQEASGYDPAVAHQSAADSAVAIGDSSLASEHATQLSISEELPDSPGAEWAKAEQASSPQGTSTSSSAQSSTEARQQKPERPVGTAAAEAPKVRGITAAEPAGVAIAPAKQKRVRTIVLKVGAIIGAGVAIGTVVALSAGTSSKPPGAH
jgi:hypothetical protein